MIEIVPAILAKTQEAFKEDFEKVINSEDLDDGWVHIDFADNKFVPNETVGLDVVSKYKGHIYKEAHLMVDHPINWLEQLKGGEFKRVIFHIESQDDPAEFIKKARELKLEIGVALNPETPIEKVEPFVDTIDLVLIMGVVPGFQGQPFETSAIDKIKQLKAKNWNVKIGVDGAVSDQNVKQLLDIGVDQLVIGSFLLKGNIDENLEKIWESLQTY